MRLLMAAILVLGSGKSLERHAAAIWRFVDDRKPKVVCLNVKDNLPQDKIDAFLACHPVRLLLEADRYRLLQKPLVIPVGSVPTEVRERLGDVVILDFGIRIEENCFDVLSTHCVLPSLLAVNYALAIACAGGARRVLMAGFDGYGAGDPRQKVMLDALECYKRYPGAMELVSVTPSTYPIRQISVYSPGL